MLAYLFWHRPREQTGIGDYEQAQLAFHRSLARTPPAGLRGSASYRVRALPWFGPGEAYEDWYLVEDYAALGVLNEAAVGRGHRTAHDAVARRVGAGTAGLYRLLEGDRSEQGLRDGLLAAEMPAIWVGRPPGAPRRMLADLLGDGMDPRRASLWQRQLVLGPAPEYCMLAPEPPPGVSATRLPDGWVATTLNRAALWKR